LLFTIRMLGVGLPTSTGTSAAVSPGIKIIALAIEVMDDRPETPAESRAWEICVEAVGGVLDKRDVAPSDGAAAPVEGVGAAA
jgi:hypothetical protein